MPNVDALSGYAQASASMQVSKNAPASSFNLPPVSVSPTTNFKINYSLGGAVIGGADVFSQNILTIVASGNAVINFQNVTDILNKPSVVLVRMKAYRFALLSLSQGVIDATNGTACSGVTIGNAASNANPLNLSNTTFTFTLENGAYQQYATGSAAGITVSGGAQNTKVLNTDNAVAAALWWDVTGATS